MARPLTVRDILVRSEQHFADKGVDSPRLSAQLLVSHGLGLSRLNLILDLDRPLGEPELALLRPLVARRAKGEPMAYILGKREFYGLDFTVTPDVLIPRPDSELFLDEALARFDKTAPLLAADLGAGSGCLGVTLAVRFPLAFVLALDQSAAALAVAEANAAAHGVRARMRFVRADFADLPDVAALDGLEIPAVPGTDASRAAASASELSGESRDLEGVANDVPDKAKAGHALRGESPALPDPAAVRGYDCILANPHYVSQAEYVELSPEVAAFEPRTALTPGPTGLEAYPAVAAAALRTLRPGGVLLAEIGCTQADAVKTLFASAGFDRVSVHKDLAAHERLVAARKPEA